MREVTTQFSSAGFSRRVVVPMSGMIVATVLLMLAFALVSASRQNQLSIESSTQLAETALRVKKREIARNLKDYAVWEDAYANLHEHLDTVWAATDGNVGANIFSGLGYEMAFVLSPERRTVYAVIEGEPQEEADAFALIPDGMRELIERGAAEPEPVVGLLQSSQGVLLVAATAIVQPSMDRSDTLPKDRSVLSFVKKLDAPFLSRIGSEYLLKDLRTIASGDQSLGAAVAMRDPDGRELGQVTWTPETPGYSLLRFLLPPMAGSLIIFGVFSFLVLRQVRRSTTDLEVSSRTIEAYAQTLKESEARFRDVAEASSDWIWECDGGMRLVYFSSRFTDVTGLSDASALGRTLEQFFVIERAEAGWQTRADALHSATPFRDLRCRYHDAAGTMRVCRLAARPMFDAEGAFCGYRGTATDITREVEAQARATHLALHDALTGLPNRTLFHERLDAALQSNKEEKSRLAVLCLDLDHFKEVNDTLGHSAGDILLQEVSERLRSCILPSDTVARLGGDEFAIVQNGVHQPLDASVLSRRIIESLNAPYFVEGNELHVGVSVGIAVAGNEDDTPTTLLKNADIALYRAKQAGRGTMRLFEPRMDLELQARKALEYDLRQALSRDQLELHYQPLIELDGERIAGVEALVRWRHPEHGLVPPNAFIPLAEDTGLIIPIGEWVLRTACEQAREWSDLRVAVNLSPVQFKHRELVDTVRQVLVDTGLEPQRLELEITESVLLHDAEAAREILNGLKELGVHIVMDDFGTGYSSLGYLNSFPFDKIKIDKSFISDLTVEKSNAIVRSVIGLGQSLNMITTAEGVETAEQAAFLLQEGCEQVQGYHFGRPIPAADMNRLIDGWNERDGVTNAA
ncbi:EAL domain-containing protein [Aureimonas sp. ME7]|uniref:bifunctional diguanylate cyclase/phosphodiesterase n=1 Tax=Aureimonas sp. ME7 TaxID=2744252 RepID=UPI0015F5EEA9|nr:EAL domain-containing protein [Aureimonas sp. ME7]